MENRQGSIVPLVGVLVLLVAGVVAVSLVAKKGQPDTAGTVPAQKMARADAPSLVLSAQKETYAPGESITLTVSADSKGTPITGFDAVISLPSDVVSYVSATSLHADFDVYPTQRDNTIFITGVKKLSSTGQAAFDGTPLAEITLTAQTPGTATLDFTYTPGATKDSNLVDEETRDILGRVEGVELVIGN